MFFKMLKNDLKAQKGLNIILFFFIISASVISVIATNLMYTEFVGRERTDKISHIANIVCKVNTGMGDFEGKKQALNDWMENSPLVEEGELKEFLKVDDDEFYANGRYASDKGFPNHDNFHLTTASERISLLYNDRDERFGLESGCMAISLSLSDMTGIRRGDEIRITTQLGTIYAFTVSEIYKTPSNMGCEELILSQVDFERLKTDEPFRYCKLLIRANNIHQIYQIEDDLYDRELIYGSSGKQYSPETDPNYTIIVVISYFLLLLSIVILLIVLITIRYMMIAAIRREQKEIGMMRAIGVDSLRYRWMFAATYITFALIGGVVGITAGTGLAKMILRRLCANMIMRDPYVVPKIALIVSLSIVAVILGFSAVMMRRISRIPVVEALRGGSSGERIGRSNRMELYRTKKLKVPGFLAISDLVNGIGKYSFLIISYTLAAVILLTVFNLKSTLISTRYQKCFMMLEQDFVLRFSGDMARYYYQKGGDYEGAVNAFVEDANNEGFPISIRYMMATDATIIREQKEDISITLRFGDTDNKDIPLRKGGALPIHANEAIISYYTARQEGIQLGDRFLVELEEYDENRIDTHTAQREFIVTGYYDIMEAGEPEIIVGKEYTGAYKSYIQITNMHIEASQSQKAQIRKQMQQRFGADSIWDSKSYNRNVFSYIIGPIDALKIIFVIMVMFILALNTTLYSSVDLADETPEIAMLKCMGLEDRALRKWHMLRTVLMLVCATGLAYLLEWTIVDVFAVKVFESFQNTGMHLLPDPLENFLIIPLIVFVIGLAAMRICLVRIRQIDLWKTREE